MTMEGEVYKNVVILGAPKCATMHLARFFYESENFCVVENSPKVPYESYNKIFKISYRGWKYKFCKTPGWIFNKKSISDVIGFISNYKRPTLVMVCIREFNELLNSWYVMRKKEFPSFYGNMSLEKFKKCKSLENPEYTYEECLLNIKSYIEYTIKLINYIDCIKLKIVDQKNVASNSTSKMFKDWNVNVISENYKYTYPRIKTTNCINDKSLHSAYLSIIQDENIAKFFDNNHKNQLISEYLK